MGITVSSRITHRTDAELPNKLEAARLLEWNTNSEMANSKIMMMMMIYTNRVYMGLIKVQNIVFPYQKLPLVCTLKAAHLHPYMSRSHRVVPGRA